MTTRAAGAFDVKASPLTTYADTPGSMLGRFSIDKQFRGDLEATSKGEMLSAGIAIIVAPDGQHSYEFDYTLPASI
jgi:hypothetical protein